MSKSQTALFASIAAIPTVWFGGCLSQSVRDESGNLRGPAAALVGASDAARTVAPIADGVSHSIAVLPGVGGDAANVAAIAATFADSFAKQMDARIGEIEARHAQAKTRSVQAEYIGAAVGSTFAASGASLAAYFAGRRRRTEDEGGSK